MVKVEKKTKVYHYELMVANRNKVAQQASNINEGLRTLRQVTLVPDSVPPPLPVDLEIIKTPAASEIDERLKLALEAVEEEIATAKKIRYA